VIRWATKNAADFLGLGDKLGTIEPGRIADIVIVNGDPSRDISLLGDRNNIRAVLKDGNFVKRFA